MSDQKSKKALKFKTLEEIQNDGVYEIHILPKRRRAPSNKANVPTTNGNDDDIEDQVISDSDNGDDSDDEGVIGAIDKSVVTTGQRRLKRHKSYPAEILPLVISDDSPKVMITLTNYLMKKRKWPYRGWHKRYFVLENGYMIYTKSEQDIKRGRINGKCDIGLSIITFIRESQRIDIDEAHRVYHLKIKEKKVFEQWLEQLALHRIYRRELLDKQPSLNKTDDHQEVDETTTKNSVHSSTDSFYPAVEFSNIQLQLRHLSDLLECIKVNTSSITTSSNSSKSTEGNKSSGHPSSISTSSMSSIVSTDIQRQDYYETAKKILSNLNGIYKNLSAIASEQQTHINTSSNGDLDSVFQSLSPTSSISRKESIFYDALEAHSMLVLNDDKDDFGKLSDSESSSDGEDDNIVNPAERQLSIPHQLKPPQIKWRRTNLPAIAPDTPSFGLWNIMRKSIGKDLSRIAMPILLNEPLGLLQKLCEEMEYSDLLDSASQTDDPHLRLVYVVAFIVSTYSANHYRTGRKTFNPLLGETYECIREDKGWKFIAEQVSHHPPVSVCTCDSPNFTFSQRLQAKIKFWGKSMEIFPDAFNELTLPKYNEKITWNKCTMCIHNVLSPERWIDHYGDVLVESSLGTKARLSFLQKDHQNHMNNIAGDIEDVTGKVIHKIFGCWHEELFCGNDKKAKCIWRQSALPADSKLYYGFTRFAMELNELDEDLSQQLPPTDTRFRPDQRYLEMGHVERAEQEKARLESDQRSRSSSTIVPKWFKKEGDSFLLIRDENSPNNYWKKREEHWRGVEFTQLW